MSGGSPDGTIRRGGSDRSAWGRGNHLIRRRLGDVDARRSDLARLLSIVLDGLNGRLGEECERVASAVVRRYAGLPGVRFGIVGDLRADLMRLDDGVGSVTEDDPIVDLSIGDRLGLPISGVISGGQTGADRAGLGAGIDLGLPIGGWAPRGFRAEDGRIPDVYASTMRESPSRGYEDRTRRNVVCADGTLLLSLLGSVTGGSALTAWVAQELSRPFLHVPLSFVVGDLACAEATDSLLSWLRENRVRLLNVAGPRESKEPGIESTARRFLSYSLRSR